MKKRANRCQKLASKAKAQRRNPLARIIHEDRSESAKVLLWQGGQAIHLHACCFIRRG
ncbi:MAG: hypothetical protein ACI9G1_004544 [Pirellulaceae bacterium]|jgi:hypothetical protein